MPGIFLEPESTFSVNVTHVKGAIFKIEEGADIKLRTCTGREYAAVSKTFRDQDNEGGYALLPKFIVSGISEADFPRLHPNAAALLLLEVAKRSHISEASAGN
jgi:hypothetical protein